MHGGWFETRAPSPAQPGGEGQLIADAGRLADVPGVIVQAATISRPGVTAWDLHRAWPQAELVMTPVAGHAYSEPQTSAALVAATDRFADR